jgi:hypothetical protein
MTKPYPTLAEQVQLAKTHPNRPGYYLFLNKIKRKKQNQKRNHALRRITKLAAQTGVDLRELM